MASKDNRDDKIFSTPIRKLTVEEIERVAGGDDETENQFGAGGCTGPKSCAGMDFAARNHL